MTTSSAQCHATPGQLIPLHYHYQMLMDCTRMQGFRDAISHLLPEGGKAVDLGGGTGVLSFFIARKASRAWCVEIDAELAATAQKLLEINNCSGQVEVVHADATTFVPPEPVDLVVCEMLHSALLREKQIQVINAFKQNYLAHFPGKLPAFIPEATFLAVQAVQQDFNFNGYLAPVPILLNPQLDQSSTTQLSEPVVYSLLQYHQEISEKVSWKGTLAISADGNLNALRFITKNVLAIQLEKNSTIDWHNFYLVLPLPETLTVKAGSQLNLEFSYTTGAEISDLSSSISYQYQL
ncbi:MAG: methyltransferase domain-containing protein [Deltaproteobacteria bacterium]|nr:methyltransferase domain-containing protein [Deltaproteobacteria bacterium]